MSALISFAFQYNGWRKVRLLQHIDFFFIPSFTNDNVLHTTSYDYGSSGITVRNGICDGSGVPWIMSAMNPCQLGGFSMKELDINKIWKLASGCDGSQAFAKVFLNLDILGFSYIFTFYPRICQVNYLLRSHGLFHYWLYWKCIGLIKPVTCVVHAPVDLSSLLSKLSAMNWRKHSIDSSSDSASVNLIVDTPTHSLKYNIAEYDIESPNAYRTSTRTRDLVI